MRRALTIFLFLFTAQSAQAASLYIDPAFPELYRGDAVQLAVRLDTDESIRECINAVEGVITYSDNIQPVDISLGDSIFSIWVEQPTINEADRTITFAGGLPNGYCGRVDGDPRLTNTLFEIIVRSPGFTIGGGGGEGPGRVDFGPQTTAYLNNGLGTQAPLTTFGSEITLFNQAGGELQNPWSDEVAADTTPPQEFGITLERDERTFGGRYYIVFNTSDKQTGLDQYQVMEEPLERFGTFTWGRADAPWITARSPYVLEDQSLNSTIRVRAIDKAGNEYVATLVPEEGLRGIALMQYLFIGGLVLAGLLVLLGIVLVILWVRRRRVNTYAETSVTEVENENHDS